MNVKININKNYILISLIFLLVIYSFQQILFSCICSDYVPRFAGGGLSILKNYNNEISFHIDGFLNYTLNQKRIAFGTILSVFVANFFDAFSNKIIHFFIFILLTFQIYRLLSIYEIKVKFYKFLGVLIFLLFVQYSNFLDPLNAWPIIYGFSFVLILEFLILTFKYYKQKPISIFYLSIILLIMFLYTEITLLFTINLILSIFLKKYLKKKDLNKTDKFFIFLFIFYFILYFSFKIYINLKFIGTEYVGSAISFTYPDSIITFFAHIFRGLPLTTLLINKDYLNFFSLYIFSGFYYPILFISIIFGFLLYKILEKISLKNKNFLRIKNSESLIYFLFIIELILFPSFLMSISKLYSKSLIFNGLGHAHYIVFLQKIGLSLLFTELIFYFSFLIRKKLNLFLFTIFVASLFYVNAVNHHSKSKSYLPNAGLFPYKYFSEFSKNYKNINTINYVVIEPNVYESWWESDIVFSDLFKNKIKVYGEWVHNPKKLKHLNKSKNVQNLIYFRKMSFSKDEFYSEFCFYDQTQLNIKVIRDQCINPDSYLEKRKFGYIKINSQLTIR